MGLPEYENLSMNLAQVRIWNRKATKRNPYNFVLAFICSNQDLGTWHRSMAHRGISTNTLAERPFTPREKEHMKTCTRLYWLHYKDWETLIVDEYLETEDIDWVQTLIAAAGRETTLTAEQVIIRALLP